VFQELSNSAEAGIVSDQLLRLDEIGSDRTLEIYPMGLGDGRKHAFQILQRHSLGRRRAYPLIVDWPKEIKDKGAVRPQFVDIIDITPTILDVTGISNA